MLQITGSFFSHAATLTLLATASTRDLWSRVTSDTNDARIGRGASAEDADFLRDIGERLRLLRARRGMARHILARQSGVSERYIAQMESGRGNGSILLIRALARALGVSPAALLDPVAEPEPATALLARLDPTQRETAYRLLRAQFGSAPQRRERIALIGLRGAGKTTLGSALATVLNRSFHELDREVEREAGMQLAEIFELHGQAGFRRFERAALERLLRGDTPFILAAGGSIVAESANFDMLLEGCRTIWLRASPAEHMERVIRQGDMRPMRDNRHAMDDLRTILASRESLYARADATLDTSGRAPDECLRALLGLIS
jgi:XRE family transcriptional regulator, aerobic/anaerobic benzoate catabolism transcriptional regulator